MAKEKFISLKEAAELSGYSPDYVGQLIRQGKLPGKQVFLNVAWMTTEGAVKEYVRRGSKNSESPAKFSDLRERIMASQMLAAADDLACCHPSDTCIHDANLRICTQPHVATLV